MTLIRTGAYPLPHDAVDQFSVAATGGRMRIPQQLRPPPFVAQGRIQGHGNMWAQRGSHSLQPSVSMVPGPTMGAVPTMGDPISAIAEAVGGIFDIFAGGPQKRARIARDNLAATRAAADAQVRTAIIDAQSARDTAESAVVMEQQRAKTMIMVTAAAGLVLVSVALIATRKKK